MFDAITFSKEASGLIIIETPFLENQEQLLLNKFVDRYVCFGIPIFGSGTFQIETTGEVMHEKATTFV